MKTEAKRKQLFWEKEKRSLIVRKKELTEDDFIHCDISTLSFPKLLELEPHDKKQYRQLKERIDELSQLDMMDLTGLSNTELRLRYGTANQTLIQTNENNYHLFLKALYAYGHFLVEHNQINEAICAYELCIQLGSDYSKHFIGLADLYVQTQQHHKLSALIQRAKALDESHQTRLYQKLVDKGLIP